MDLNFLNAKTLSMKKGGNKIKIKSISGDKKLRLEYNIVWESQRMIKTIIADLVKFHQSRQEPAFHWPKTAILASKGW